jgi:hypothetical protein
MGEEPPAGSKIIFGTMRLLDADRSIEQFADYFEALHDLGIRRLHSSHEYESFPLLTEVLKLLARRAPDRRFRHMVKLAEPSFDDDDAFSASRLTRRIDDYRRKLAVNCLDDVQWMWRRKLDDDSARISDFSNHAEAIGEAVRAERGRGAIGRVFCFPYSPEFALAAVEQDWTDGLAVYRNTEERAYEIALRDSAALGKTAIVIRPFFGGKLVESANPATLLTAALNGPAIEAAVLSTNSIAHMRSLLSATPCPASAT